MPQEKTASSSGSPVGMARMDMSSESEVSTRAGRDSSSQPKVPSSVPSPEYMTMRRSRLGVEATARGRSSRVACSGTM